MMKRGDIGINTIVYVISAIVFLFVVLSIFVGGFGPLRDRAVEMFDWLPFRDSGDMGECDERLETIPDIATGMITACDESCTFDSGLEVFLGASKFKISGDGFEAWMVEGESWKDVDSWGNDLEESESHRDAYKELVKVFDEFYGDSGKSKEEFFEPLEFNPAGYFRVTVDLSGDTDVVFDWNGKRWLRTLGEHTSYEADEEVFTEIYDGYRYGYNIYWNYRGDGTSRIPISGFNVKFMDEDHSEGDFDEWLVDKMDSSKDGIYVEIEDFWRNTVYFYKDGEWKRDGIFIDAVKLKDEVLEGIFEAYSEGYEIVWYYDGEEALFTLITNEEILSRSDTSSEEELRNWFNGTRDNWTDGSEERGIFFEGFSGHLLNSPVSFYGAILLMDVKEGDVLSDKSGEEFKVVYSRMGSGSSWEISLEPEDFDYRGYVDISGLPNLELKKYEDSVYRIISENNKLSSIWSEGEWPRTLIRFVDDSGDKFGMYYHNERFVLTRGGYSTSFEDSHLNDVVLLDDGEWAEFLKINKIYEYLARKCRL